MVPVPALLELDIGAYVLDSLLGSISMEDPKETQIEIPVEESGEADKILSGFGGVRRQHSFRFRPPDEILACGSADDTRGARHTRVTHIAAHMWLPAQQIEGVGRPEPGFAITVEIPVNPIL